MSDLQQEVERLKQAAVQKADALEASLSEIDREIDQLNQRIVALASSKQAVKADAQRLRRMADAAVAEPKPRKPRTPADPNAPKRPRGRPRKAENTAAPAA